MAPTYCIFIIIILVGTANSQLTTQTTSNTTQAYNSLTCAKLPCVNGTCVYKDSIPACRCDPEFIGAHCSFQSNGSSYCASITSNNYYWPDVPAGKEVEIPCAIGARLSITGTIRRNCSQNGEWEKPDLSNCTNPVANELLEMLAGVINMQPRDIGKDKARQVMEAAYELTKTTVFPINVQNLQMALRIVRESVTEKPTASSRNLTLNEVGHLWYSTASNCLKSHNLDSYSNSPRATLEFSSSLLEDTEALAIAQAELIDKPLALEFENMKLNVGTLNGGTYNSKNMISFPDNSASDEKLEFPSETIKELERNFGNNIKVTLTISKTIGNLLLIGLGESESLDITRNSTDMYSVSFGNEANKRIELGNNRFALSFKKPQTTANDTFKCGYWDPIAINWKFDGLELCENADGELQCCSNHATSFGIIIQTGSSDTYVSPEESLALSIVTYILLSISMIALLLSLILLLSLGKELIKKELLVVHFNFALSLFLANFLFIFGVQTARNNRIACGIMAGLIHYMFTAVFSWSLCEGIVLIKLLFFVLSKRKIHPFLIILGWGLPVPIVAITAGIGWKGYGVLGEYCWLSTENGVIWGFVGPALTILLVTFIILIVSVIKIATSKSAEGTMKQARVAIIGSLVLMPVLGIPWVVAIFNVFASFTFFEWVFVLTVTPQGLMFFLLYILRNQQIRDKVCFRKTKLQKKVSSTVRSTGSNFTQSGSVYGGGEKRELSSSKYKKKSSSSSLITKNSIDLTSISEKYELNASEDTSPVEVINVVFENDTNEAIA